MTRLFTLFAAAFMFLAVGIGAFGSHALRDYFAQHKDLEAIFDTAVRYHMIHAVALLGVAWASGQWSDGLINWAGWLLIAGIFIFAGSLYVLSLTGIRWLGAITPIGGVAFLAGWACLFIAAWRN
jgi:uncharacterized membrane protein YgdD (TMEM256/DUF423 family)